MEQFPSESVAAELDTAVSAEPGSFIVFDSMVFHRAGENRSGRPRRAVNQVFSVPIIAQQISLTGCAQRPLRQTTRRWPGSSGTT